MVSLVSFGRLGLASYFKQVCFSRFHLVCFLGKFGLV